MRKRPNPYLIDDENPEWTEEDFRRAVPSRLIHPDWVEAWQKQRDPKWKAPLKQAISIRVDKDVLATFKATGSGWQKRMNAALRMGAERLTPYVKKPIKKRSSSK
jgi:uncharacterized protein (DUF4415 family)